MDFIVKMNIVSQIVNWIITIAYFATPLADKIKDHILLEAVAARLRQRQQREVVKFIKKIRRQARKIAIQSYPLLPEEEEEDARDEHDFGNAVAQHKASLIAEIRMLAKVSIDLDLLSVTELNVFRHKLYKREVHCLMNL